MKLFIFILAFVKGVVMDGKKITDVKCILTATTVKLACQVACSNFPEMKFLEFQYQSKKDKEFFLLWTNQSSFNECLKRNGKFEGERKENTTYLSGAKIQACINGDHPSEMKCSDQINCTDVNESNGSPAIDWRTILLKVIIAVIVIVIIVLVLICYFKRRQTIEKRFKKWKTRLCEFVSKFGKEKKQPELPVVYDGVQTTVPLTEETNFGQVALAGVENVINIEPGDRAKSTKQESDPLIDK